MGEGQAQESMPFSWSQCLGAGMRDPGIQGSKTHRVSSWEGNILFCGILLEKRSPQALEKDP